CISCRLCTGFQPDPRHRGGRNAFCAASGPSGEHVFWICLTCAVSDAILITAGVAGFGSLATHVPWFEPLMRYGGALFLFVYGIASFLRALRGGSTLVAADRPSTRLRTNLLTVLAFTWLNPHVYLDTVVLIGSISAQYSDRLSFGLGAVCASFVFFFSLGYGARLLAPIFARARAWQALDVLIGVIMWAIAIKLLVL
ncbi:UNVERIFIED_CONTAM: hypothetical protein GTU68_011320, partial [Idotea baltica]|nr:hypothetical protein [Idotea baltica]